MSLRTHRFARLAAALALVLAAVFAFTPTPARATTATDNSAYGFFEWVYNNASDNAARNDAQAAIDILVASNYLAPSLSPGICDCTYLGSAEDASSLYNLYPALNLLEEINNYRAAQGKNSLRTNCAAMAEAINQCNWFSVKMVASNAYSGTYVHEVVAYEEQYPLNWWTGTYGPATDKAHLLAAYNVAGVALHFDGANWEYNSSTMSKGASWDVQLEYVDSSQKTYTVSQMKQMLTTYINQRVSAGMAIGRWVNNQGYYYLRLWYGGFANDQIITMNGKSYGFGGDSICYMDTDAYIRGKNYHFGPSGAMFKSTWFWCSDDHAYHYANADGTLAANAWRSYNGTWYYLDANMNLAYNTWVAYGGNYYYLGANGQVVTNSWVQYNGLWYYLGSNGNVMTRFWIMYGGKEYYLGTDGQVVLNAWVQRDGYWYYLGASGQPLTNQWQDGYYLGEDGRARAQE